MDTLDERRKKICLKFAKNCLKNEKVKNMFPQNESKHGMTLRRRNRFKVNKLRTQRYKKSAVPYMQTLLNNNEESRKKIIREPD